MLFLQNSAIFEILENLYDSFLNTLPKLLSAVVVFVVGWIIAKVVSSIIHKVLVKSPIDELAQKLNDIDIVEKTGIKIVPSTVISKIFYYLLLLFFSLASAEILDMPAISELMQNILAFVPRLLTAAIVLMFGTFIADAIKNIISTICASLGIPSAKLIAGFVFWFIFLTVFVSALTQAGINTDFIMSNLSVVLAGGVFAFALGYGIASKDMMANFLASFYSRDKFKIGDLISIEGITGEIIDIDNNSLILQAESKRVIVPLKKLSAENVEIHES